WKIFEEINLRLSREGLGAGERADLTCLAEAMRWRDLGGSGALPEGDLAVVLDGDRLGLQYGIREPVRGRPVPAEEVLAGDGPLYVQDAPGLNNLDWGVSVERTLQETLAGGLGRVVALPEGGIARF